MTSIKNELVGSWQLLSYIEISVDGSDSFFPLGNNPNGILIYAADGYMSAQIFGSPVISAPTDSTLFLDNDNYPQINKSNHLIFSGSYHIDNRSAVVSHQVMASISPNLIGKSVERNATFESDVLYLKSTRPVLSYGKMVNSYMTWQRMEKFEQPARKEKRIEFESRKMDV